MPSKESEGKAIGQLRNLLEEDTEYYTVEDFDPSVIFTSEFLVNFVRSGELVILSDQQRGPYVQESLSLYNKELQLSLVERSHQLNSVEEHFQGKIRTKDGLRHFSLNLSEPGLKESQLRGVRESVSVSEPGLAVKLTWSHPEPAVCPSSVASHLSQAGLKVRQSCCLVKSHVVHSVPVPQGWAEEDVEELVDWAGGVALGLSLPPPSLPLTEGSVLCVQSSGLHTDRTLTHLLTSLASDLLREHQQPWLAVAMHGPRYKLSFSGKDLVQVKNSNLTVIVTRNGQWMMKESSTRDFSYCKK